MAHRESVLGRSDMNGIDRHLRHDDRRGSVLRSGGPVIVAVPAPAARICAVVLVLLLMLAMPVLLDPNVTVAPLTGLPFTSVTVAVVCVVWPTATCDTLCA